MQTESSDAKPNKLSIPALNRLIDSVKSVMYMDLLAMEKHIGDSIMERLTA